MATSRKQREENLDVFAKGSTILSLLLAVWVWFGTHSLAAAVAVFLAGFVAACLVAWRIGLRRRRRLLEQADAFHWDNWEEFEASLCALFRRKGCQARLTSNGADHGADVIVEDGRGRTVVQAKYWRAWNVGPKAIDEVLRAKTHYRAHHALVITNTRFTEEAIRHARTNQVELWDGERLRRDIG